MKKVLLLSLMLMLVASLAFAQGNGSVSGTVRDSLNNPVAAAMISLMTEGDCGGGHHGGGGRGMNYHTQSADDGTFSIADVAAGDYRAMAAKMMVGRDIDSITVVANQNTVVNFVLATMCNHDSGGMHGDSMMVIDLTGWAIVEADSMHTHYFLDNNGDDIADYRLLFGPDWYDPGNGAQRPADGDSIWIAGGLMGYSVPQPVVVNEINGLFWRDAGGGHGGYGGMGGDCPEPDSITLIETTGGTIVRERMGMTSYYLDTNYDNTAEYHLNFGCQNYDPGNGAQRPNAGDTIDIVGGLMEGCMMGDVIIVYEINGQFWRDPGDTTLLWSPVTSITDSEPLPVNYLIAKSYPNPFNPTAVIAFELPQTEQVQVAVYDLLGREVAVLANGIFPAGQSQVTFNADNYNTSSIYFYKVTAQSGVATGKMVLLK